jgi:hypothetical protein
MGDVVDHGIAEGVGGEAFSLVLPSPLGGDGVGGDVPPHGALAVKVGGNPAGTSEGEVGADDRVASDLRAGRVAGPERDLGALTVGAPKAKCPGLSTRGLDDQV